MDKNGCQSGYYCKKERVYIPSGFGGIIGQLTSINTVVETCQPRPTTTTSTGSTATTATLKNVGEECNYDEDCESNWCECNYGYNLSTGAEESGNWKKECKANPRVCIGVMGQQDIGCDFIRFYRNPNLEPRPSAGGTSGTDYIDIKAEDDQFNTNQYISVEIGPGTGTLPLSYEAFVYRRNAAGDVVDENGDPTNGDCSRAAYYSCGPTACGCKIAQCQTGTFEPASGACRIEITGSEDSEFTGFAYNTGVSQPTLAGIRIQDKSKMDYVSQKWTEGKEYLESIWGLVQ
jgi:hypothetical protein